MALFLGHSVTSVDGLEVKLLAGAKFDAQCKDDVEALGNFVYNKAGELVSVEGVKKLAGNLVVPGGDALVGVANIKKQKEEREKTLKAFGEIKDAAAAHDRKIAQGKKDCEATKAKMIAEARAKQARNQAKSSSSSSFLQLALKPKVKPGRPAGSVEIRQNALWYALREAMDLEITKVIVGERSRVLLTTAFASQAAAMFMSSGLTGIDVNALGQAAAKDMKRKQEIIHASQDKIEEIINKCDLDLTKWATENDKKHKDWTLDDLTEDNEKSMVDLRAKVAQLKEMVRLWIAVEVQKFKEGGKWMLD